MAVDLGVFDRIRTKDDYDQLEQEFQMKKQLAALKMAHSAAGGDLPAAIQIANEYGKARGSGDEQRMNDLILASKALDKGVVTDAQGRVVQLPGYAGAVGGIEGVKSEMKQQGQKNVDLQMNPQIAAGEAAAKLKQQLNYEPQIEAAKATATAYATEGNANARAIPAIEQLKSINDATFESPYSGAFLGAARLSPFDSGQAKVTATDKLNQARLELAAPLAKQLGVNPTDKDFQASLDRIFNSNSSQASRAAQIEALGQRTSLRQQQLGNQPVLDLYGDSQQPTGNFTQTLLNPQNTTTTPKLSKFEVDESIFNAKKAIRNNPGAADQVRQRLIDAGIDPKKAGL